MIWAIKSLSFPSTLNFLTHRLWAQTHAHVPVPHGHVQNVPVKCDYHFVNHRTKRFDHFNNDIRPHKIDRNGFVCTVLSSIEPPWNMTNGYHLGRSPKISEHKSLLHRINFHLQRIQTLAQDILIKQEYMIYFQEDIIRLPEIGHNYWLRFCTVPKCN